MLHVKLQHLESLAEERYPTHIPDLIRYLGYVPWCLTPYAQTSLGGIVRASRELLGLRQVDLIRRAGLSQGMISYVEHGRGLNAANHAVLEAALKRRLPRQDL